jgi:aspartate/methionine/tyrosine aminotransferase
MRYVRMPIEIESPEQMGYANLRCNLTESSFADAIIDDLALDLRGLTLAYTDHRGHPGLRELIADDADLAPGDVLLVAGAAAGLFIIATALLSAGDHLLVVRPNYATNIETPRAIGAAIEFLDLRFEDGWRLDLDELAARLRPETTFVSLTCPHNPTGTTMTLDELDTVIALVEANGSRLVFDETYREMSFPAPLPVAASRSDRVISVSSVSKTYGLPGLRMGWILSHDAELMETFLAAKEQIFICNSIVDEALAFQALEQRSTTLPAIRGRIEDHRSIVAHWFSHQDDLEWVEPSGGVVGFPRLRADRGIDVDRFYEILNGEHQTFVGPGHWFDQPRSFMRIGFGWPTTDELRLGLDNISRAAASARAR